MHKGLSDKETRTKVHWTNKGHKTITYNDVIQPSHKDRRKHRATLKTVYIPTQSYALLKYFVITIL